MPVPLKLNLEDALDDRPQNRVRVGVFEQNAQLLREYFVSLFRLSYRVLSAHKELCDATSALAGHLRGYSKQNFPLYSEESPIPTVLSQCATYMEELSSIQDISATHLSDALVYPLNRFIKSDLDENVRLAGLYKMTDEDVEESLARFLKCSKKRDEKERIDTAEELYQRKEKRHLVSLGYYSSLNSLQLKHEFVLLEPLVGYLQAQKSFYEMSSESIGKQEIDDFIATVKSTADVMKEEYEVKQKDADSTRETIEKHSKETYQIDPLYGAYEPHDPSLLQADGYLHFRTKQVLLSSRWDRYYFFIQSGHLMWQKKDEVAGTLFLNLNEQGLHVEPCEIDDRWFVFQINQPSAKRILHLQAESYGDMCKWVSALRQLTVHGNQAKVTTSPRKSPDGNEMKKGTTSNTVHSNSSQSALNPPGGTDLCTLASDATIQFSIPECIQTSADKVADDSPQSDPSASTFSIRLFGSQEVEGDRGERLIQDTIRRITASRALHDMFKMTEYRLQITAHDIRISNLDSGALCSRFKLEDISYWATLTEHKKRFGLIARKMEAPSKPVFTCYIFESDVLAEESRL